MDAPAVVDRLAPLLMKVFRPTPVVTRDVSLRGEPGTRGEAGSALVVVRHRGVVLGTQSTADRLNPDVQVRLAHQVLVDVLAGPCTRDGYAPDDIFRPPKRPETSSLPTLTAAVCTTGVRPGLAETLTSLRESDAPVEVMVVDNGSAGGVVEAVVQRVCPQARVVPAPVPGLDRARNVAAASSGADIVAFLDDDVVADRSWARTIRECFHDEPRLGVVTGIVLPQELETPAQQRFENYAGFSKGFDRFWWEARVDEAGLADESLRFRTWEVGTGANMAVRRSCLRDIGGFDPALDVGTPARGCGDLEMFFRAHKSGWSIRYEPGALVWHRHRRSERELRSQVRGFGGFAAMLGAVVLADPAEASALVPLSRWFLSYWTGRISGKQHTDRRLLAQEIAGYGDVALIGMWRSRLRARQIGDALRLDPVSRWNFGSHCETSVSVQLNDPQPSYLTVPSCRLLSCHVWAGSREIGEVRLHVGGTKVSLARLRATIAAELGWLIFAPKHRDTALQSLSAATLVASLDRASPRDFEARGIW